VFAVLAVVCLGTVFVFGFVPALHTSKVNVQTVLKESGRHGTDGMRARRWTTVFLSAQLALAFILLAMTALGVRVSRELERIDVPIVASRVMTTSMTLPAATYTGDDERAAFYERLLGAVTSRTDVAAASIATTLSYDGATPRRLAIEGRETGPATPAPTVGTIGIGPRYFASLGTSILRGRDFSDADGTAGRDAAIVNARFAEIHFPTVDPIGRRLRLALPNAPPDASSWITIVGISPTLRALRAASEPADGAPIVYLPFRATPAATATLLVRGVTDSGVSAARLRDELRMIDPDVPIYRTMTMEQALGEAKWNSRASSAIVTTITIIAALLALVGFYAVTAHAVANQMRELGIRVALGARPRHVGWLVLRRALLRVTFGLAAGVACTVVWERLFDSAGPAELGMHLTDVTTLAATAVLVVGVCAMACLSPARRATRVDPVRALRYE
jgi:predicted permease